MLGVSLAGAAAAEPLSICVFQCDATPPLGSPLCDAAGAAGQGDRRSAVGPRRGARGRRASRSCCARSIGSASATAATTPVARPWPRRPARRPIAWPCIRLHQHDAPGCDFEAEALLASHGLSGADVRRGLRPQDDRRARPRRCGSRSTNRRRSRTWAWASAGSSTWPRTAGCWAPTASVKYVRYSSDRDPAGRAAPEGTIDPQVRLVSFWNGEQPLAVLSYYATHPQSYYGQGGVSYDFVGMARAAARSGAAGRAADSFQRRRGQRGGRQVQRRLAGESAAAGRAAGRRHGRGLGGDQATSRSPPPTSPGASGVSSCRPAPAIVDEGPLAKTLDNPQPSGRRSHPRRDRSGLGRAGQGRARNRAELPAAGRCLRAAHAGRAVRRISTGRRRRMKPEAFVAMAAYGDYGPGYIGTRIAYTQGATKPATSRAWPPRSRRC